MRIFEKTVELTLCAQISMAYSKPYWPPEYPEGGQPLWFGLTQKQEALAGFDAATKFGDHRILILQFKSGKRLKNGRIKFTAQHSQLCALQNRVKPKKRLILYVLPSVTATSELNQREWMLESTWFLDVFDIPALSAPGRASGNHHIYLDLEEKEVEICSDPVKVSVSTGVDIFNQYGSSNLGVKYDNFEDLWECAKHLGKGAVAAVMLR